MGAETFAIKIFTPAGLILEDIATTVTVPGSDGEIGLLPQHIRYTGALGAGVIEYRAAQGEGLHKLAVAGGFCTFSEDSFTVLADWAALPEDVDRNKYAAEREQLAAVVNDTSTWDPAWSGAKEKLARIEALDTLLR